ncbi:thioredoxin reductase [Brachybacterium phenoliresistens]|uniref:Thioredoxin reductase n=1 Tax=Brachybacterium phenoliresistens TaxID=396014 RepID=Z9JRE6_9MICO|nr:NAD(P)/FAD-dependent oxidoreductase [Brachybacterium phenoliresistens]EWS80960.1 thioredoxin reductase [Brachybacterium phenoliresistens]
MTDTSAPTAVSASASAPVLDALVIGGGAAGLAGALMLARSRRDVLVLDAGAPRNAPSPGVHALLALDGIAPAELLARGREDVRRYGGRVLEDPAVAARREEDGTFTVTAASGAEHRARRLLLASGVRDELPAIDGLAERFGRDVVHCPYCHGYEVRDQAIGVIASSPMAVHSALMFRQLSADVVLLENGYEGLDAEGLALLTARGVRVEPGRVRRVLTAVDAITGVELEDGRVLPRTALAVQTRLAPLPAMGEAILPGLGLALEEHPSGMGTYLAADPMTGATAVPGVWAAGNLTNPMAQVAPASAAGGMAGAQINADLVMSEARAARQAAVPAAG